MSFTACLTYPTRRTLWMVLLSSTHPVAITAASLVVFLQQQWILLSWTGAWVLFSILIHSIVLPKKPPRPFVAFEFILRMTGWQLLDCVLDGNARPDVAHLAEKRLLRTQLWHGGFLVLACNMMTNGFATPQTTGNSSMDLAVLVLMWISRVTANGWSLLLLFTFLAHLARAYSVDEKTHGSLSRAYGQQYKINLKFVLFSRLQWLETAVRKFVLVWELMLKQGHATESEFEQAFSEVLTRTTAHTSQTWLLRRELWTAGLAYRLSRSALNRASCAIWAAFLAVSGQGNSTPTQLSSLPFGADESLQRLSSLEFSDHLQPSKLEMLKCKSDRARIKRTLRLLVALTTLGPLLCHSLAIVMIAMLPWSADQSDSWVQTVSIIAAVVCGLSCLVYCGVMMIRFYPQDGTDVLETASFGPPGGLVSLRLRFSVIVRNDWCKLTDVQALHACAHFVKMLSSFSCMDIVIWPITAVYGLLVILAGGKPWLLLPALVCAMALHCGLAFKFDRDMRVLMQHCYSDGIKRGQTIDFLPLPFLQIVQASSFINAHFRPKSEDELRQLAYEMWRLPRPQQLRSILPLNFAAYTEFARQAIASVPALFSQEQLACMRLLYHDFCGIDLFDFSVGDRVSNWQRALFVRPILRDDHFAGLADLAELVCSYLSFLPDATERSLKLENGQSVLDDVIVEPSHKQQQIEVSLSSRAADAGDGDNDNDGSNSERKLQSVNSQSPRVRPAEAWTARQQLPQQPDAVPPAPSMSRPAWFLQMLHNAKLGRSELGRNAAQKGSVALAQAAAAAALATTNATPASANTAAANANSSATAAPGGPHSSGPVSGLSSQAESRLSSADSKSDLRAAAAAGALTARSDDPQSQQQQQQQLPQQAPVASYWRALNAQALSYAQRMENKDAPLPLTSRQLAVEQHPSAQQLARQKEASIVELTASLLLLEQRDRIVHDLSEADPVYLLRQQAVWGLSSFEYCL